ncbi:MAG TPA: tail fiber protein [Longimicrobiales bacterium]
MEPFIGEIRMFGGTFAPVGWAFCDGKTLPIEENQALFALLGTTYGGDGVKTFALPDLRGRVPIHVSATDPPGQAGGSEAVALTPAQFPAHSHAFYASTFAADSSNPGAGVVASTVSVRMYGEFDPNIAMNAAAIGPAVDASGNPYGSASPQPHDNMQPFLCINYIIATEGIYPPRD